MVAAQIEQHHIKRGGCSVLGPTSSVYAVNPTFHSLLILN
jgi:hypothetical protein